MTHTTRRSRVSIVKGDLKIDLHGERLKGRFGLIRMRDQNWVTLKEKGAATSTAPATLRPTDRSHQKRAQSLLAGRRLHEGDLARYYKEVAPLLLPHLRDRPQSLHRHPNGIRGVHFFQKEVTGFAPQWAKTKDLPSYGGAKTVSYLICNDIETLMFLINMGCIEINSWLSRIPHILEPDFAVLDLDPGKLGFDSVIKVAKRVRVILDELELESFPKTSGSRGLHIYIPVTGERHFRSVRNSRNRSAIGWKMKCLSSSVRRGLLWFARNGCISMRYKIAKVRRWLPSIVLDRSPVLLSRHRWNGKR